MMKKMTDAQEGPIYLYSQWFLHFCRNMRTVQNLEVMKKIEVAQEAQMYTHNNVHTLKSCCDWAEDPLNPP